MWTTINFLLGCLLLAVALWDVVRYNKTGKAKFAYWGIISALFGLLNLYVVGRML